MLTTETMTRLALALVGLGAFTLLMVLEVVTETGPITLANIALESLELLLTITAAGGLIMLISRLRAQHEEKIALLRDLDQARALGETWRKKAEHHVEGLGAAIEQQFEDWDLSAAERSVAIMMLKGFTHKEIANLRGTNETTVRHQAHAVYTKTKLESRQAFCAFFLEDLMPAAEHR